MLVFFLHDYYCNICLFVRAPRIFRFVAVVLTSRGRPDFMYYISSLASLAARRQLRCGGAAAAVGSGSVRKTRSRYKAYSESE